MRRHRHDYIPGKWARLCSVHFKDEDFDCNVTVAKELGKKIRLNQNAVPSIDTAVDVVQNPSTPRERRLVNTFL